MSLPDKSKLESIREADKKDSSLGLPTRGRFWSSSERNATFAYDVYLDDGDTVNASKNASGDKVLCVGEKSIGL